MKRLVTLQFPTLESLKAFQQNINLLFFELSAKERLLYCACTDEQIELAKTKFKAAVVDKHYEGKPTIKGKRIIF